MSASGTKKQLPLGSGSCPLGSRERPCCPREVLPHILLHDRSQFSVSAVWDLNSIFLLWLSRSRSLLKLRDARCQVLSSVPVVCCEPEIVPVTVLELLQLSGGAESVPGPFFLP